MTGNPLEHGRFVTDGGLETDLIFHRGVDLPEFAAFPLVDHADGRHLLTGYYDDYAAIARDAGAGLLLETPTWRANPDWGAALGYDAADLDRFNQAAVELLLVFREQHPDLTVLVSGNIGPRGDGYVAGEKADPDEAADYHAAQVRSLTRAGVDAVHALTLTGPEEAVGVVRAARDAGIPVGISFTVETDGRLPDGTPLADAIGQVDAAAPPDWFGVNCAHPTHVTPGLDGGAWQSRISTVRPNASTMTHEELDAMEVLDEGDLGHLASSLGELRADLPALTTIGGCCGTDARHVRALWGV
ncbi:homocysteine S-methyltransferase family protein [Nocardioides taihuensis]|uniref:Homocysteine S-methyltransferase family protein n=1 Tax=Nocardioides taihuensis TaxID=1835606 RepID=A0ABW0BN46_9ACTN